MHKVYESHLTMLSYLCWRTQTYRVCNNRLHTSQLISVGEKNSVGEFGWPRIGWGENRLHRIFGWGIRLRGGRIRLRRAVFPLPESGRQVGTF